MKKEFDIQNATKEELVEHYSSKIKESVKIYGEEISYRTHLSDLHDAVKAYGFDKVLVYKFLDFLKENGNLSNLSHDAITSFIKYL